MGRWLWQRRWWRPRRDGAAKAPAGRTRAVSASASTTLVVVVTSSVVVVVVGDRRESRVVDGLSEGVAGHVEVGRGIRGSMDAATVVWIVVR